MARRPSRAATTASKIPFADRVTETNPRGYFATSVRRERPSWWTPEKVLDEISGGEHPILLCQRAASETDGVTVRMLRHDISVWAESASWGDQFRAALALHPRQVAQSGALVSKDWYPAFFAAMERDDVGGRIALACHFAEVGPEIVYALRDRQNKCYDAKFDEQCRILEGRRFSEIRESFLDRAVDDGKLAAIALESGMPGLHGKKSKLEVTGSLQVDHRLPPEVVEAARSRQRALLESRTRGALREPAQGVRMPVIDAEFVRVDSGAPAGKRSRPRG